MTLVDALSRNNHNGNSPFEPHYKLYPRSYTVHHIDHLITVDGNIEKDAWKNVPWSEPFRDIQGCCSSDDPANIDKASVAETRFKAVYNDTHLYIAAILHPSPNNMSTQAHFTKRNSPIFQKDSDFEVFIDAFHSNHQYKELEINALNTVWNLCLDKPYWDGGVEHSGRVAKAQDDPLFYEVYRQQTGTVVVSGKLNDPQGGALWTVELALAFTDLLATVSSSSNQPNVQKNANEIVCPQPNTRWRINFSRVEKRGAINWTWQEQRRWDPTQRRFAGFVDMHLPDAWGYLVFGGDKDAVHTTPSTDEQRDPEWPVKLAAMTVYYAQKDALQRTGSYASATIDLVLPNDIVKPFEIEIQLMGEKSFVATVRCAVNQVRAVIRDDRLLTVHTEPQQTNTINRVD